MASENQVRPLRVPAPSFDVASTHRPLKVLSLTGGGYRGLFTAQVLVELCDRARRPGRLDDSFDVFGGTSIGGLMACALAVGVPPRRVLDAIDAHGPLVFVKKRQRTLRRVFFGTLYDSDNLAKAIDDCLGRAGRTKLKNIDVGIVVPAVDWAKGTVELFLSGAFGKAHASEATLRDVCLATSAAPTYFKPHVIDGAAMLDGGLAANNPDTLILLEVAKRWPERFARTQMLSIGTAGADPERAPEQADKTGLGWASELAIYMMGVQERSAAAQAQRLLGAKRYLRVNHQPNQRMPAFEQLDLATDEARTLLLDAATTTARAAYRSNRNFVDRVLTRRTRHVAKA
jgi:patatin-like phospholipase/acyl hydrolase